MARSSYWIGKRPSDGKRWATTSSAMVLDDASDREAIFRMYRRYVKQWNDIELNTERSLSEQVGEVCGAEVVGDGNRFILEGRSKDKGSWILEVLFARGFSKYYPGLSCGLNTLRSPEDIRSIRLHWKEGGQDAFRQWLKAEAEANKGNGEWDEYRR